MREMYDKLRAAGLSRAGVCGLMGNLMAESALISNIAQRGMTELSDAEYTTKFDNYPDSCVSDSVGYGLAQWTYPSRKQALWSFAHKRGESVGSRGVQLDFIVYELHRDYPALWDFLCSTGDIYAAADRVCREYERPAVNNVDRRYAYALELEAKCPEPGGSLRRILPLLEQILEILKEDSP